MSKKNAITNDCPLFQHANGQWAKKVRGKLHYFGKDLDAALKRWADEKDYLLAGRPVQRRSGKPTLEELGNVFIDACRKRLEAGELSQVSVDDYTKTIARLIEIRGGKESPEFWGPLDFAAIKQAYFEPVERKTPIRGGLKGRQVDRRSPVTVDGDIRCIKAFLNWCADCELIPSPRFGKEFMQSSRKSIRKAKNAAGRRDIPAEDIRAILDQCSPHFKPVVLLAINGGVGQKDIANIRMNQMDGNNEWLDLPRIKTGAQRRIWLWPETRQAVREYLKRRMAPMDLTATEILFVTKYRSLWMRGTDDAVGKAFVKVRREVGVSRGTFYDLRRTFQTIGDQTKDYPTVKFIMGHVAAADDMSASYRQHIDDKSIKAVCSHVRKWLFGKVAAK